MTERVGPAPSEGAASTPQRTQQKSAMDLSEVDTLEKYQSKLSKRRSSEPGLGGGLTIIGLTAAALTFLGVGIRQGNVGEALGGAMGTLFMMGIITRIVLKDINNPHKAGEKLNALEGRLQQLTSERGQLDEAVQNAQGRGESHWGQQLLQDELGKRNEEIQVLEAQVNAQRDLALKEFNALKAILSQHRER